MSKTSDSPIKTYTHLDISQLYPEDLPDDPTAYRLAGLVMLIIEEHLPLDIIERFCQSLNWSDETRLMLETSANEAYQKMKGDISDNAPSL